MDSEMAELSKRSSQEKMPTQQAEDDGEMEEYNIVCSKEEAKTPDLLALLASLAVDDNDDGGDKDDCGCNPNEDVQSHDSRETIDDELDWLWEEHSRAIEEELQRQLDEQIQQALRQQLDDQMEEYFQQQWEEQNLFDDYYKKYDNSPNEDSYFEDFAWSQMLTTVVENENENDAQEKSNLSPSVEDINANIQKVIASYRASQQSK